MSAPTAADRYVMVHFPAGWDSDFHPAPRRQLLVIFSGRFELGTSDGSVVQLAPGGIVLMDDTSGKGHSARVIGADDVHGMMVHLS